MINTNKEAQMKTKFFLSFASHLGVLFSGAGFFFLVSCSSPSARESRLDVRPGVDGIHRVVVISKNQIEGSREAESSRPVLQRN